MSDRNSQYAQSATIGCVQTNPLPKDHDGRLRPETISGVIQLNTNGAVLIHQPLIERIAGNAWQGAEWASGTMSGTASADTFADRSPKSVRARNAERLNLERIAII